MTPRRRLLVLALCLIFLLPSCRSWERYPDVSFADLRAGLQLYVQAEYPHRSLGLPDEDGALEVEFSSETSPWLVFLFLLITGGLFIPVGSNHSVAVRPDGEGGSELSVEAASRWLIFYCLPIRSHEEPRERRVQEAIVANARRRQTEKDQALETVLALLDVVRRQDRLSFDRLLWTHHEHRDRAPEWLEDRRFWAPVHSGSELRPTASDPPHVRRRTTSALLGLTRTTHRYECMWVDVAPGLRVEAVKAGDRYQVVLPTTPTGELAR